MKLVEKRRPKGSGSIYTLKDGIVVGRYEVDTPEGKKRKYIRGKTKREVASKLARDSGLVYDSGNLAVGQYLDTFLDSEKDTVGHRHWRRHEELVRLHIKPAIGSVKLDKLSPLQLQSLYRSKLNSGLLPET